MLEIVVLSLSVFFLALIALEPIRIRRLRSSFDHVVHVAGTRGKTTVTRLIGAALRHHGISTFTKVTGTLPVFIDPDGVEHPVRRHGQANIREQLRMMRIARKYGARILVIESMAIRKAYAEVSQHKMLRAGHVVFTNMRADHLEESSEDVGGIRETLESMIPKGGHVHLRDEDRTTFESALVAASATMHVSQPFAGDESIDPHPENIALALSVATTLGVDEASALEGMRTASKDIGNLSCHTLNETTFINLFAMNDVESIRETFAKLSVHPLVEGKALTVLINNRIDRPKRAMQHLAWLKTLTLQRVLVAGPFFSRFKRALSCEVVRYNGFSDITGNGCILGIGNLKGAGLKILEHVRTEGTVRHG